MTRLPIAKNKGPHVALLYLKMVRKPIKATDLTDFNKKMFENGKAVRALTSLTERGYATENRATWTITEAGRRAVALLTVVRQPRN